MNHYEVLGVATTAEPAVIRRAYLTKARAHHPDFHTAAVPSEQAKHAREMQALNQAWEVLKDPARRAGYDLTLRGPHVPPTERIRPQHSQVPKGKGWTPRADDTGWMTNFAQWRDEDERLPEDSPGQSRRSHTLIAPGLLVAAVVAAFLGVALQSRPLMAVAFVALVLAAGLFVLLPLLEMSRAGVAGET